MSEQRGRTHHRNRVVGTLRDEVAIMIEGELSDPRIGLCHVTEVLLAPGGKSAKVFISVEGDEKAEQETREGLMAARAYIRTEIRDRMGVRHIPELTFIIDRSEKLTARVDELLDRTRKREKKAAG